MRAELENELLYLNQILGDKTFSSKKFEIMKRLRCQSISKLESFVTHLGSPLPDIPPFHGISSRYARETLHIAEFRPPTFFYPSQGEYLFLNSGQAALNVLFLFLREKLAGPRITKAGPVYHETQNLLDLFAWDESASGPGVLLIDSQSFDPSSEIDLTGYSWVVIDSTCWDMRAPELNQLIDKTKSMNLPCLVARSHIKLDSLGGDYGLLGSLFHPTGISGGLTEGDWNRIRQITATFRLFPHYSDLYPFWGGKEFGTLTKLRNDRIRLNTRFIEEILTSHFGSKLVETFPHALYCYLYLPKSIHQEKLRAMLKKLSLLLSGDLAVCDSFGFDPLTICTITDAKKGFILRIAGSTLEKKTLEKYLEDLIIGLEKKD